MLEGVPCCGTSCYNAGWSQVSSKTRGAAVGGAAPLQTFLACMLVPPAQPGWVLSTFPMARSNPADPRGLGAQAPATTPVLLTGQWGGCGQGPRAPMALEPLDWYRGRGLPRVLEPLESLGTLFWVGTGTRNSHGTGAPGLGQGPRTPMALESLTSLGTRSPRSGQGTHTFLFQWLALKVMEAETPLSCQPRPSPTGHGTRQLHAPLLAPRLCWHQPESEASLIGSCVCGQSVMKRFSVSLCKFP